MMAIPSQVLKDAEEAEKLYREAYGLDADGNPIKQDEKPDDKKPDEPKLDEPKPDDKPDKPDVKPDVKPKEETVEYWKQRFEVTDGMIKAQVPDLTLRLNATLGKLEAVEAELNSLKSGKSVDTDKPLKTLEEIEKDPSVGFLKAEYPDVWKGISTVIQRQSEDFRAEIESIKSELKKQGTEVTKSNKERFYDDLDTSIKGWEQINTSLEFNQWLDKKDRYTGVTKRALLNDAYAQFDSGRVKNFFEDFAAENTPKDDIVDKKKPEDKKVVVDSPKNAGHKPPADTDKISPVLVKASEITEFYDAVQRGVYRGREADMKKREVELEKAIAEGRVI